MKIWASSSPVGKKLSLPIIASLSRNFYSKESLIPANLHQLVGFNAKAVESLARRMHHIMKPYVGTRKYKICISRSDGVDQHLGRDFVNTKAFEKLLRDSGYLIVEVSRYDLDAQLELWANTTDIMGVHGAGMMNMIMMPQGGNHTEIIGASYINKQGNEVYGNKEILFSAIAAGHRVRAITSKRNKEGRPEINLEKVRTLVKTG